MVNSRELILPDDLSATVSSIIERTAVVDVHTHLFPPQHTTLCLAGLHHLLTYHYLTSEFLSSSRYDPEAFFSLPIEAQAGRIWRHLFVGRSPISEAARGIITVLSRLGLDPNERDYERLSRQFPETAEPAYASHILTMAGVESLVMTNNPFDEREWALFGRSDWDRDRYHASIRLDDLFFRPQTASARLGAMGYATDLSASGGSGIVRFLDAIAREAEPRYFALSLSSRHLTELMANALFCDVVIPWLAANKMPLALMLGVRREINPALRLGGDGMADISLDPLEELLTRFPDNVFAVTAISRESQHRLSALGRIFPNLRIFGFWWFLNQPGLVKEGLSLRLDLLGLNFIAQHSDARVLEQLLYKWLHFKEVLASVMGDHYRRLVDSGWELTREAVARDVGLLLSGNAKDLLRPASVGTEQ